MKDSDEYPSNEIDGPSVNWPLRTASRVRSGLRSLEAATLRLEKPVDKIVGTPRLNPLYHTGTISVFLFAVVFLTGVYLTGFYQYGFEASYEAVAKMNANLANEWIRAVHRYGSVALVVTSLLHGWRTLFQDRFRGARWVAWVSGVVMMVMLWIIGVTGYWLIWDERAEAINELLIRTVGSSKVGLDFLIDNLLTPVAETGWPLLLLIFLVHLGLSIAIGVLIWVHLKRLSRAKLLPPRFWIVLIGSSLAIVAIVWPLGMLPALSPDRNAGAFPLDPFYLFMLPAGLSLSPTAVWGGFVVLAAAITAVPWLLRRKSLDPVVIHEDRCTGCTLCVADCPYDALEMIPREDDSKYRQLAIVNAERCVSCAVCVGSCPTEAITVDSEPAEAIWDEVKRLAVVGDEPRIVLTCERHALQGARDHLGEGGLDIAEGGTGHVIPVPCVGMIHPGLVGAALDAGAGDVQIIGCPPADCANREGNTWLQARLDRRRVPRLKREYVDRPVATDWVAPNRFLQAVEDPGGQPVADPEERPAWRRQLSAVILVTVVSLVSIALSNIRYTPPSVDDTRISIAMEHAGGAPLLQFPGMESALDQGVPPRLVVSIDDSVAFDKTYDLVTVDGREAALAYEQIPIEPGTRHIEVTLFDRVEPDPGLVLFDDTIHIVEGQVFNVTVNDSQIVARADVGRAIFLEQNVGTNAGCRFCHSLEPGEILVGPSLDGVATRAQTRIPGLTAEEYLRQSIIDPKAYVVDGFQQNFMIQDFAELLSPEEIDNLVAFLLTLE